MKLALIVALCTVAAAVSPFNPAVHSSVFKPGQEYVYHYKGQVLSGIPKSSKQFAGILIDSLVVMQFQQDNKVAMKMEKIKLYKINNKINSLPSEPLPESEMTRLTGEQASVITQSLVKPIKFRYEEGKVHEVEKEVFDPYWSVNIKKGVLSLFQVTLKENTPYSSDATSSFYPDPVMSRVNSYRPRSHTYPYGSSRYSSYPSSQNTPFWKMVTKPNTAYKVQETDVMGACESKYVIISDKDHLSPGSSQMHVSRVKNFEKCSTKPFLVEGLFQGVHRSVTEKDLIQPTVHTDFVISGDRSHFLIKEAKLRGKFFFLVNGLQGGDLSTYIFQQLTIKSAEPISQPIHLISPKIDPKGLLMIIPKSSLIPEKQLSEETISNPMFSPRRYPSQQNFVRSPYSSQPYYQEEEEQELYSTTEQTDLKPIVEMKLEELIQCLYPTSVDQKCSTILYQLSRIIREMNKPQLKEIIMSHLSGQLSSQVEYRKSEVLLDILPTLPSPDAAKVLIELIKEKQISEIRGSLLIKAMSMLVKPTPSVITKLFELVKELPKEPSSTVSQTKMLRQASLLAVGTLTHRLTNVMRTQTKPIPEIITFIEKISSELYQWLETESSLEEKILILKSIGNMGVSESILPLKNLIEDPNQPKVIKVNAIFALRRLAKEFDKQVSPILLSTFMDVKELREIRQAAFVVLFNAKPSYTTLQMIAHRVRHEPSSQIRTLVYSSLVNLAMYSHHQPELKDMAKNARLIMKTLPPVHVGVHDSISVLLNKFSEEYDLGGALNLIKIKSPMSGVPESLVANLQGTLFGKHRRLVEVGATGKSLEMILKKFFGPYGLLTKFLKSGLSLEDIMKPLNRVELGHVEQKIRQVLSQMMLESSPELEPFGITSNLYLHVLGNELQFATLNSHNIKEVIEKVTEVIPELLMKLTRGVNVDIVKTISHIATVNIASPLGIPLSLNATTMGILKVEGHVKVDNLPTFSDMLNRFSSLELSKINVHVDLKPVVDAVQTINMGADMRWLVPGVGAKVALKTKLPIKLVTKLDTIQHSLTVKKFIPKEPMKMLSVVATPYTFVKYQPIVLNKLESIVEIHELKAEEIVKETPFEYKYPVPMAGLEVETHGVYSLCGPSWCPIMPLFGKQELTLVTRPISNVDFVTLKVKSLTHNLQFEGIPVQYTPEELFVKDPEDIEEEQSYYNIHNSYRPQISQSMLVSGEFEPIAVSPIFTSHPIKRQVLVTLAPNTIQTPKVKALLTWLMSRQYWENQLNVQVIGSSYGQTPAWKVLLDAAVNPLVYYPEETYKTTPLLESKLKWNIFEYQNELKMKIVPGSPFNFPEELREHSILPVLNDLSASSTKVKYTLEVEVMQMTHELMKYITVAHDLLKYQFFSKLSTSIPVQPTNKIIVSVEVLPWWEKMDVIVKTPRENSYISNIPVYWNPFHPTSEKMILHDIPAWKWYKSLQDKEYFLDTVPYKTTPIFSGKCSIDMNDITTFDSASYPMSSFVNGWKNQNCETVLAQHCSNEGLFSVLGYGFGYPTDAVVKILIPKNEITLSMPSNHIVVSVNGEQKYVTEGSPVIVTEPYYTYSPEQVIIKKLSPKVVEVKVPELGVKVKLNFEILKTEIKLSPVSMLQGQLCGLCGNFNQDQSDDLYTPSDFQLTNRDLLKTITKNIIKSPSCNLEKFKTVSNEMCLKPIPKIVSRYENSLEMTCTSQSPVPQCAPGCKPESTTSVKTCFTCISQNGSSYPSQTYIPPRWDAYDNESISCPDFFQRVEVPTSCVEVY